MPPNAPTPRQAQFLRYIHQYIQVNGRAPAEADMQSYFRVTPPVVHTMVLALERGGFISRMPAKARSISLLVDPSLYEVEGPRPEWESLAKDLRALGQVELLSLIEELFNLSPENRARIARTCAARKAKSEGHGAGHD